MPRIVRHAAVEWQGSASRGAGTLGVESGALDGVAYSLASRIGRTDGSTSPEELLAAAHGACFAMSLATELGRNGTPPERIEVAATVIMDEVSGQGHLVVASELEVTATVPGLDEDDFARIVEEADEGCPFATLIKGTASVSVSARLAA